MMRSPTIKPPNTRACSMSSAIIPAYARPPLNTNYAKVATSLRTGGVPDSIVWPVAFDQAFPNKGP